MIFLLVTPSSQARDDVLKNTSKMKEAPEVFKKVYIKKDIHPVYADENKRLRSKMIELRKKPENKDKQIKIVKGDLMVDNEVVASSTFKIFQ